MSEAMDSVAKGVVTKAAERAAELARLKEAVPVHPALKPQVDAEAEAKRARDEKGKFVPEKKPDEAPPEPKKAEEKKPDEQALNFARLREEVAKAQERAKALEAEVAAMRNARPVEPPKPPPDPMEEVRQRALARVPRPEDRDYWEKVVLPTVAEVASAVVAPIKAQNDELRSSLHEILTAGERQQKAVATFNAWSQKHNLTEPQKAEVVGAIEENGLADLWRTNPEAALNAARGLLIGQGKMRVGPSPEEVKAAQKATREADEAEDRARAKAGGVDSSAEGSALDTEDARPDWNKLMAAARARGDMTEVRRIKNMATIAAAGVDREWLAGRKVILGPE